MIEEPPAAIADPQEEIAALVRTLHHTQQRLQDLADGQVDAVIHPGGHSYMLHEAQEKLRENEALTRLLVKASNIGLWDWNLVTQEVFLSPEWKGQLGYTDAELPSRLESWESLLHPGDRAPTHAALKDYLAGRRADYEVEFRLRHKDGSWRWILTRADLTRDAAGQPVRIMGCHIDVTERKRADEALHRQTTELRVLFDLVPAMIWFKDTKNGFLRVNRRVAEATGMRIDEIEGKSAYDIFPQQAEGHYADDLEVIRSGAPKLGIVEKLRSPGDQEIWVHTDKVPVCDPEGKVIGLVALVQDVTERKKAEQEIRFNEQRFRSLVEATTAIVWDTLASGELEGEQASWAAFTGQSYEEFRGWGWLQAIHPDDRAETARVWTAAVATRSLYQIEHRLRARDQTYRHMMVRGVPVLGEDGTIRQWIGIHTDITERKKIEQQFLRAQRMESIGTLAGGIAHDLNNAFGPIIMGLDLLERRFPDPESRELISMIGSSAEHGAGMVRQVLSFARGVEGERVEAQVVHLIQEVRKIAHDTFPKRIEIRTLAPKDLWTVLGDPTQLHQVLMNLCVNARDAMPHGGTLNITAENLVLDEQYAAMNLDAKPGPYLLIQVEDTGTGMPADLVEKIFDPFFTTKEVGKGTGLGLSTTMAIVKSHGGFLRVYSELGKGTKFSVYLPAQAGAAADTVEEAAPEIPRGHGELILVVDDESALRQITQQTLEDYGYRVILAADGAAGIAVYLPRRAEIAVVLMDMMMPVMDGPAAIRVLRKMSPKLPIIGASGLAAQSHVTQSADLGVKHFLPKPYTAETLLRVLKRALAGE